MNTKRYKSLFASVIIFAIGLFGVYPQYIIAQTVAPSATITYCKSCGFGNFATASQTMLKQRYGVEARLVESNVQGTFDVRLSNNKQLSLGRPKNDRNAPGVFNDNFPALGGKADARNIDTFTKAIADGLGVKELPPQQQDEVICIPPRPGQASTNGPITDDPSLLPGGQVRDTAIPVIESELNFALRKLGSATQQKVNEVARSQTVTEGTVKLTPNPTRQQAEEFVKSLGGNPNAQGSYTIDGVKIEAGKKYRAGVKDPTTGITFDEDCKPTQGEATDPNNPQTPGDDSNDFGGLDGDEGGGGPGGPGGDSNPWGGLDGNEGGGGFGGPGGGAGGQDGGLAALLPLLMQGLFGGSQQGKNNQDQYGAGYGSQVYCEQQAIAPVCGTDGKTYNNSCFLNQFGIPLQSNGVCPAPSSTQIPNSAIESLVTLDQLTKSGIPSSLIENVRTLVATVLSTILNGSPVGETVVP